VKNQIFTPVGFTKSAGIGQAIQVLYGLENPAFPVASLCEAKRRATPFGVGGAKQY